MHRVVVIGCGGAGKTTFARALAARLELPAVHLDALRDGAGDRLQGEQFRSAHARVIREERWVIDGMRFDTLEARLTRADTAIYLDLPARSCYAGIVRRRIAHRGRDDPESGVFDRITWQFLRWVWSFHRRDRPRILALLRRHAATTRVVVLHSRSEGTAFLARLRL